MKKFHITWFIDEQKTTLTGITVEAKNAHFAIDIAIEKHNVLVDNIKYIIEI
jgi:hypothetical protein